MNFSRISLRQLLSGFAFLLLGLMISAITTCKRCYASLLSTTIVISTTIARTSRGDEAGNSFSIPIGPGNWKTRKTLLLDRQQWAKEKFFPSKRPGETKGNNRKLHNSIKRKFTLQIDLRSFSRLQPHPVRDFSRLYASQRGGQQPRRLRQIQIDASVQWTFTRQGFHNKRVAGAARERQDNKHPQFLLIKLQRGTLCCLHWMQIWFSIYDNPSLEPSLESHLTSSSKWKSEEQLIEWASE